MTFEEFVEALDTECQERFCVSIHDLPIMPFREWYDEYGMEDVLSSDMEEEMEDFMDEIRERADIPDDL